MYLATLAIAADPRRRDPAELVTGSDALIAGYLEEELPSRLPEEDHLFLMRTSVLHELTGALCDVVLSATSSAAVLKRLSEANVLLHRVDGTDGEWYRLHPLFREALQADLLRRERRGVADLHRRASRWLEAHDRTGAAIEHAIASRDVDRAARLIWSEVAGRLQNGDVAALDKWLDGFTPLQIARHAKLALTMAWSALQHGHPAEHWITLAEQGRYETDRRGESASVASSIALLRAVVARDGLRQMGADARRALGLQERGDPWACTAEFLLALSSYLTGGGDEPHAALEHVELLAQASGSHQVRVLALTELTLLAADKDDWKAARAFSAQATLVMQERNLGDVALLAVAHCAAALVAAQGQPEDRATPTLAHAHRAVALAVESPTWSSVQCREILARAELAIGKASAARAVLSEAQRLVNEVGDDALRDRVKLTWRRIAAHPLDVRGGSTLTRAEMRVLRLLPTHLSFGQIGERLFVSRNTVKTQAVSAYRKLGVTSRREAVEKGVALGLIVPTSASGDPSSGPDDARDRRAQPE